MSKNCQILNRDFTHPADGWYQIEAKGNHPNARAGVVQIIDDEACQAMATVFNRDAAQPSFAGMLIDHEHFKHDEDKETVAYGWLTQLQNRADGLYGQIRWTGTGKKAVDDGDYRFFSTEYDPADLTILNSKKPKQVRPTRLDGLTLTNANNNKGQKPITNRGEKDAMETKPDPMELSKAANALSKVADASTSPELHQSAMDAHKRAQDGHNEAATECAKAGDDRTAKMHAQLAAQHGIEAAAHKAAAKNGGVKNREFPNGNPAASDAQKDEPQKMKTVIAELGLPADASETAVLAEVKTLRNRNTELQTAQVETDLELYKNRFDPKQKDFIKNLLVTNRASTIDFLKGQPEIKSKEAPARLHNRGEAEPIDQDAGGDVKGADAAKISQAIDEARTANPKLTYESARNQVRNRKPELFGLPARKKS